MEVHHHAHTARKKWTHYLWEFLMLFLAVFCGFLAENVRENIKDKEHVHEYMESILNDLQSDINMYNSGNEFNALRLQMIDSLIIALETKTITGQDYYRARQLTMGSSIIAPTTKTYEQMKSSGVLRLINKHFIADSIASYYQWNNKFDYWSDLQKQRISDVIGVNERIFDATLFYKALKQMQPGGTTASNQNVRLISTDQKDINAVIMKYKYYYGMLLLMDQRMAIASAEAKRLAHLIKQEYHLE